MNMNYPKKKDVFFKNTLYKVDNDDLRHINGVDVVKLPNELIVYWNDIEKKWKTADNSIIELYTNKKQIDVEFNGEVIKVISNINLYEKIDNEQVTLVNIKCLVSFDKKSNTWKILNPNDDVYKKYSMLTFN